MFRLLLVFMVLCTIIAASLTVFFWGPFSIDSVNSSHAVSGLVCAKPYKNFGRLFYIPNGLEHDFHITNTSNKVIELEVQATSCRCNEAVLSTESVRPGEETILTTKWKPAKLVGRTHFSVLLKLNTSPPKIMKVGGEVEILDYLRVDPKTVNFKTLKPAETKRQLVRIWPPRGESLSSKMRIALDKETPGLIAEIKEKKPHMMLVEITVHGDDSPGSRAYNVCFITEKTEQPRLDIPVRFEVLGKYIAEPNTIIMSRPQENETQWITIESTIDCENSFAVEKIDLDDEIFKITTESVSKRKIKLGFTPRLSSAKGKEASGCINVYFTKNKKPLSLDYLVIWK